MTKLVKGDDSPLKLVRIIRGCNKKTRSSAVAVIADRTAYRAYGAQ